MITILGVDRLLTYYLECMLSDLLTYYPLKNPWVNKRVTKRIVTLHNQMNR